MNWNMLSVRSSYQFDTDFSWDSCPVGIVADDANQEVLFHAAIYRDLTSSSVSSFVDTQIGADPFDFSIYMDQVSLLHKKLGCDLY